ncbi:MAG TPA: hypothetical protein VHM91_11080 [Verrucomicrobiales bacterium]|jgi:hypothetical protein|nr:hypothetical protein [Verrucomicrobiales bacterium]
MTPDAQPAGDHSANQGNSRDSDLIKEFTAATNPNAVPLSEWVAEVPQPPQKPPWLEDHGAGEQ